MAGARVLSANGAESALCLVESHDLSGAVLDWIDADICRCLTERGVPLILMNLEQLLWAPRDLR